MRNPVYVVGVENSAFAKTPNRTLRSLADEVAVAALADAGVGPDDIDLVVFANGLAGIVTEQEGIRGQVALRHTGLLGVPVINVENACASGGTAVHVGAMAIRSGMAERVLVVAAERLSHEDRSITFKALAGDTDLDETVGEGSAPGRLERAIAGPSATLFMEMYTEDAHALAESHGLTVEDLADVVVKSRLFASMNPLAQFRNPVTRDDVLGARRITDMLTLPMCAPIADGASAIVLAGSAPGGDGRPSIRLASSAVSSGSETGPTAGAVAASAAYELAGVTPEDLDVVELHDAAAPAELMRYEELGLCEPGGAVSLLRSGATGPGGRLPVNPSGGLLSRGHPVAATGCAQVVEIVGHLRGEVGARQVHGARLGLAQTSGGAIGIRDAAAAVCVLERVGNGR